MRMTNLMMQNNTLYNINLNKTEENRLNDIIATGKKISRPSQDPIVAIRSLRLRNTVSELSQYYDKNVKDARNWMDVTASNLSKLSDILQDSTEQMTKAANKDLTTSDLDAILAQVEALKDEYYSIGRSDYAGRYIFTNLRTDTALAFDRGCVKDYTDIKETIDSKNIVKKSHLIGLESIDVTGTDASDIIDKEVNTLRLSYDKLNYSESDGKLPQIFINNADGSQISVNIDKVVYSSNNMDEIYKKMADDDLNVCFDANKGEFLFSDSFVNSLSKDSKIEVSYDKNKWENGDIVPEHLFNCKLTESGKTVEYNKDGILDTIEYNVGYSQKIKINTSTKEVYDSEFSRNVEELKSTLSALKQVESQLAEETDAVKKDALQKAYDNLRQKMQVSCEENITNFQKMHDKINLAVTNNGTRQKRLNMTEERLEEQLSTFKTLKSENEDADIAEMITQFTMAQTIYNASLMATGKLSQTSLINFI